MNPRYNLLACILLAGLLFTDTAAWAQAQQAQVVRAARVNTSQPLRDMVRTSTPAFGRAPFAVPNKMMKFGAGGSVPDRGPDFADPVRQQAMGPLAPTIEANFDGSSDFDNEDKLGFRIVPPDTQGDVGPNHYVQWINLVYEIFDKNGNTIEGPFPGNDFFNGLGGICETTNDGDPIVLYDERADRWFVSQFAVPGGSSGYAVCVAVSTGSNPTGAYHQYEFNFGSDFPDYFKVGIWGDSYIMTTRDFANGQSFAGLSAVALDRTALLNGNATSMVRFPNAFSNISDGALPADADTDVTGPALFGAHGADGDTTFELWEMNIDWANPGSATFGSISGVGIPAYDGFVPSANQPNGQSLDDLSSFTMHRLNVRDFGTHVSMVANHTVEVSTGVLGVRWYEFRDTGSGWTLHQSGTYSPDSDDRWMGSIAINAAGDISLGYSRSSSSMFPSIYFTGQTANQCVSGSESSCGNMNVAETLIHPGGGSQSGASRWGDYSMMSVDPSDDTFWFTTEYYASTGSFDFNTRIANFDLTGAPFNNPPVVTITNPANGSSFAQGTSVSFSGTANDNEDGDLSSALAWTSSLDGLIGSGAGFNTTLSLGTHTITAEVTDSGNPTANPKTGTDQITVTIFDPSANDVHVASIVTESVGRGKNKMGQATVTIVDQNNVPVSGYNVTGTFGGNFNEQVTNGPTNANGVVVLQTTSTAKGGVEFCVDDVSGGALAYDPTDNADPAYDCGGGPPPPPPPGGDVSVHVESVVTDLQGKRNKRGRATVTLNTDQDGNPGAGYNVTGVFSGDFNETASGVTGDDGSVTITTSSRSQNATTVNFCVSNVSGGTLPYDETLNTGGTTCPLGPVAGKRGDEAPDAFVLEQNYPNPFNPTTIIAYSLGEAGPVALRVYNLLGQEVTTLVDTYQQAGQHRVAFNADELSAGVYLYVIEADGFTATRRMTLLK